MISVKNRLVLVPFPIRDFRARSDRSHAVLQAGPHECGHYQRRNVLWTGNDTGGPVPFSRRGCAMRRIAIINQKGGVGKTTTAVNLAAALALAGRRVCVLDLDPQAHATTHLGVEPDGKEPSMYDVLVNSRPLAEARRQVDANLWIAGSDINLAAA